MAKPLLPDELWERVEPLLPEPRPRRFRFPGRKPVGNRQALTGILFVLKSGIPWEMLPQEMGCGCGMTCWRRLRDWQAAGVWERLHQLLLAELDEADLLDWSRAAADSAKSRALGGGDDTGPNPTDRGKPGVKHHVMTDGQGVPLSAHSTGANTADISGLLPLVEGLPGLKDEGGEEKLPEKMYADRAYDSEAHRETLRWLGIEPLLAKRGTEHGSGLGVYRWVAERALSWLHQFGRLRVRRDRRGDIHDAFLKLACGLITFNFVNASLC
jgi:transposase